MRGLLAKFLNRPSSGQKSGADTFASLIMAAKEDEAFRARLVFILKLPLGQPEPLVKTAVDEMRLKGEPAAMRAAFAALSTDEGARTALELLNVD